jgi:hypothetical protein
MNIKNKGKDMRWRFGLRFTSKKVMFSPVKGKNAGEGS